MSHAPIIGGAALAAIILRQLVGLLRRSPKLWGRLRPWAPLLLLGLSALAAGAAYLAGVHDPDALLIAASIGPGAVAVEEIVATGKRRRAGIQESPDPAEEREP